MLERANDRSRRAQREAARRAGMTREKGEETKAALPRGDEGRLAKKSLRHFVASR